MCVLPCQAFLGFWVFQMFWVFGTCLSIIFINSEPVDVPLGASDYIGWAISGKARSPPHRRVLHLTTTLLPCRLATRPSLQCLVLPFRCGPTW